MAEKRKCRNNGYALCGLTEDGITLTIQKELKPIVAFTEEQKRTNDRVEIALFTAQGEDKIRRLEDATQQSVGRKHLLWAVISVIPIISAIITIITHYWK